MAGLSPNDVVDEVLLSEVRLPPPQELTRVTAVPEEDDKDERLKREIALLRQERDALQKIINDFLFKVETRELLNNFRHGRHGGFIFRKLLDHVRREFPSDFCRTSWDPFLLKNIYSFDTMVIELVNLKDKLQKEKKDPKYRLLKIDTIDKKLRCLRTAAKSFTTTGMHWDASVGEAVYAWCLLVVAANKACHRDVTKEFLRHMSNLAGSGECKYGGVEIGPALEAIIRLYPSSGVPSRSPLISTSSGVTKGKSRVG